MGNIPDVVLNDGRTIPQLGFGVFLIEPRDAVEAVSAALEVGYRHIDTAQGYGNEQEVGEAIRASGLDRGEVFVTSKLNNGLHRRDDARRAFDATLAARGFDYLDLFLIHWPLPTRYGGDFVSTWKTLEEVAHLERLAAETATVPAVNQIEAHPWFSNDRVRAYGRQHGIVTEAWSPLARGGILPDPTVGAIAAGCSRTPSQVVLRWHIQRGDVVFPKTTSPARMRENLNVFDFELEPSDVAAIDALDRGEAGRIGPHPDTFDAVPD
jgi:2,5-diketo-D-gluconate reductase A